MQARVENWRLKMATSAAAAGRRGRANKQLAGWGLRMGIGRRAGQAAIVFLFFSICFSVASGLT